MIKVVESIEESGLRRWGTILWTQSRPAGGRLAVQVRQYFLVDRRFFNAGNDLDLPVPTPAGLDVKPDAAQLKTRLPANPSATLNCPPF
jgi:hypothetical protein